MEQVEAELRSLLMKSEALENFVTRKLNFIELKDGPLSAGDTGFMILCTALVFLMTVPGLGLYYSGMVRVTDALTSAQQSFTLACLITFVFFTFGYSLAFGPVAQGSLPVKADQHSSPFIGDASRLWYWGISADSVHQLAPTIPESVFAAYQLSFAIIAAALICGAFADRVQYGPLLVFITLWHIAVYCPIAHSCWYIIASICSYIRYFLNECPLKGMTMVSSGEQVKWISQEETSFISAPVSYDLSYIF